VTQFDKPAASYAGAKSGPEDAPPRADGARGIAMRLRQAILDGQYVHAERLPAERQLAMHFGVSRGTTRAALRELEAMNLVTRRMGSGTYVHHPGVASANEIADATSPLELIEVRFALEPHMANVAVMNARGRDVHAVRRALERARATIGADEFTEADAAFHLALAECTQNPLIIWLYRHVNEVRGHAQWSAVKQKILGPERVREYNQQHRRIYHALERRDPDQATAMMRTHLETARSDLLGAE